MFHNDTPHMETFLKIRKILEKNYVEAQREIGFYTEVRRMLVEKFTGKRVDTKRTLTYIQSQHPTWIVTWYNMGNSLYLRVWGGDSGFKDSNDFARVCMNKCRDIGQFDATEFDRDNPSIPSTIMEQAKREKLLNETRADEVNVLHYLAAEIDAFNDHKDMIVGLLAEQVDHYDIEKLAKL